MFHSCQRLTWSWWSRSCMSWVRSAASRLASSSLALLAIASRHPSCIHSFTHSFIHSLPVFSVYRYIQSYSYTVAPSGKPSSGLSADKQACRVCGELLGSRCCTTKATANLYGQQLSLLARYCSRQTSRQAHRQTNGQIDREAIRSAS